MSNRAKAVVILIAFVVASALFQAGRGGGSGVLAGLGAFGVVICLFLGFRLLFSKRGRRRG